VSQPYRPSNGTEGDSFMAAFCERCMKFSHCKILARSMAFRIDDPEYPTQWIRDDEGARCTSFQARGARRMRRQNPRKAIGDLFQ
jgi:hypothetical protein